MGKDVTLGQLVRVIHSLGVGALCWIGYDAIAILPDHTGY